jgi:hypothetical protein
MMTLKNIDVLHNEFLAAFERLMYRQMPAKQCLELSVCLDELTSHRNVAHKAKAVIIDKYGVKDKEGKVVVDVRGNVNFKDDDTGAKCVAELKEIDEDTIEIPLTNKVTIYDDEEYAPIHLRLLKDVLNIIPRPKTPETPVKSVA